MTNVAIIGIGQTPVGEHWESSLRTLATDAVEAALQDAGLADQVGSIDAVVVGNAYGATFSSQAQLAPLIADHVGLRGVEAFTVEAGDASGGAALRSGAALIASGMARRVLVVGVEKSSDMVGSAHLSARNISLDADYESIQGVTLPSLAALLMRRYMHEYQVPLSAFEPFSINAHANGSKNRYSMYKNQIKLGAFGKAPMVADPVTLFDAAPDADGAAAVILTASQHAGDLVPKPIQIASSTSASDSLALHDRDELLWLEAIARSTRQALEQAGIDGSAIDLFELQDAYTILSVLTLEAAGFANVGEGWKLAENGGVGLTGTLPISTFGGMKSRGNPAGASGVYQAVEAVLQLRGDAGTNQVADAKYAMIQNVGGLASTVVTHILKTI